MAENLQLKYGGDPREKEGCYYGLNEKFPRYETFWARYIVPSRRLKTSYRLKPAIPKELEFLYMAHYSTWHHFTVAYRQISILQCVDWVLPPPVELEDPLFHLSSAIDTSTIAVTSALLIAECLGNPEALQQLAPDRFNKVLQYASDWRKELKRLTVSEHEAALRESFLQVRERIAEYRNPLTHEPMIRRFVGESKRIRLPKETELDKYWLWSAVDEGNFASDYEEAHILFRGLADDLVAATNDLWEILLTTMKKIQRASEYREVFLSRPAPEVPGAERLASLLDDPGIISSATTTVSWGGVSYSTDDDD